MNTIENRNITRSEDEEQEEHNKQPAPPESREQYNMFRLFMEIVRLINRGQLLLLACMLFIFLFLSAIVIRNGIHSNPEIIRLGLALLATGPLFAIIFHVIQAMLERKQLEQSMLKGKHIGQYTIHTMSNPNKSLTTALSEIIKNLDAALEIDHPIFRRSILNHFEELWQHSTQWHNHEMEVSGRLYKRALIDFYRKAESNVFCTCLPDYFHTWDENLGKCLLRAHNKSSAIVRRVFIFEKTSDVTEKHIAVMKKLHTSITDPQKMRLFIWIDEDDLGPSFSALSSKDFTFIDDGIAIGYTHHLGTGNISAKWHFNSQAHANTCRNIISMIMDDAIPFHEFKLPLPSPCEAE